MNNPNEYGGIAGLLSNIGQWFNQPGGPAPGNQGQAGAPMDIRPQPLQQAMQPSQPAQAGNGYNMLGDIGWRMMAAGQRMTPQQREQMLGSIPGAVAQNNYAAQMRQQPAQGQSPVVGLLGNGAPMTPEMAQGNNAVWANMGKGLNADGTPNTGAGFPGANQLQEEINRYRQPIAGSSAYGMY